MATVTKRTMDISGFGGGYEDMCQRMLWRGVAYLTESKPPVDIWEGAREYRGVFGVMSVEGDLKALEAAIIFPGEDVTGAMHQAVMNHLAYIHHHGVEQWLAARPDGVIEWTGSLDPQS